MAPSSTENALSWTQIATGIGILTFWFLFFAADIAPARPPACYFPFEHSFPLPDSLLALALLASGVDRLRGGQWGNGVSLACAGGLIFLGLIDLMFTAQNGGFGGPLADTVVSVALSVWCVALGAWIVAVRAHRVQRS